MVHSLRRRRTGQRGGRGGQGGAHGVLVRYGQQGASACRWRERFVGGGWDDSNMCLPEQSARDAALAELARLDPAALDAACLMDQIGDLATFISQAQAQLSRL